MTIFGRLATTLEGDVKEVLGKTALRVEAGAKRRAPVDTGALRNSIHAAPDGEGWTVTVGQEYGPYVEYGTRRMAAQPFFHPAIEEARRALPSHLRGIIK